jgi:hypothetical protein
MTSLAVLAWMSLTSAILHFGAPDLPAEPWIHLSLQVSVLLAILIEAGSLESGRPSRWRRPTQMLALLAFIIYLGASHWHQLRKIQELVSSLL